MKKIMIMVLCVINFSVADSNWDKLLHSIDGENQVVSKEFYLSGNISNSPQKELEEMIELLKTKYAKDIVCNFPARYKYLIDNKLTKFSYKLNECKELQEFKKRFSKKNLSIVYTSEYNNNPSSAFGHTMLLFSNSDNLMETGDVIHFAANTDDKDGFLKYSYNGLKGLYYGHFVREKFFKKIYEYNVLEQRFMNVYKLNYTEKEIDDLINHIYELRKAKFKYYFLDGNCATNTTDLLNIIDNKSRKKSIFYLPIESIDNKLEKIYDEREYKPLLNTIYELSKKMTKKEKSIFLDVIENNYEINNSYPNKVKEALYHYTVFNFRRYHKVFKNYNNIMSLSFTRTKEKNLSNSVFDKPYYRNISLNYIDTKYEKKMSLSFRPLFIDLYDIQNNILQESEVKTFSFESEIVNDNIKLNRFDLINIKSYAKRFLFHTPYSWELYSGLNRNNKDDRLKYNNEFGLGISNTILETFNFRTILDLGFDNLNFYLKPKINISKNINKKVKISGSLSNKINIKKEKYMEKNVFISLKNKKQTYKIEYKNKDKKERERYLIGIKYSF